MRSKHNKDGSVDYTFTVKEFNDYYVVGCMTFMDNKKVVMRVRGTVKDLSQVVIRKPKKKRKKRKVF